MKNHRCLALSASTITETCVNSIYRQDIKQINHGCPGYTVHIPPLPSGFALVLGVVYERYIQDNHGLSITYIHMYMYIQCMYKNVKYMFGTHLSTLLNSSLSLSASTARKWSLCSICWCLASINIFSVSDLHTQYNDQMMNGYTIIIVI